MKDYDTLGRVMKNAKNKQTKKKNECAQEKNAYRKFESIP